MNQQFTLIQCVKGSAGTREKNCRVTEVRQEVMSGSGLSLQSGWLSSSSAQHQERHLSFIDPRILSEAASSRC